MDGISDKLPPIMRTEVFYKNPDLDGRAKRLLKQIKQSVSPLIENIRIVDVFISEGIDQLTPSLSEELFSDPVAQKAFTGRCAAESDELSGWNYLVEITYRPGVTNPVAITAKNTIETALGKTISKESGAVIQTAVQYLVDSPPLDKKLQKRLKETFYNPLIQQEEFREGGVSALKKNPLPGTYPHKVAESDISVETIHLASLDRKALDKISKERLLALSTEEMESVRDYFAESGTIKARKEAGLGIDPTDVELEMIAQTWSEHCKHKIFNATIEYKDAETGTTEIIKSLFSSYIKKATKEISKKKGFLKSVFHDNSGVIDFDDENLVCFKVETHNSPSALDPYGGSITGIVGVNRDIMGTGKGARPFFNTNVLCFGEPDTPEEDIPEGLLHPKTVMKGVHHGIIDGGNQSGIPTVAGAFLFDESFTGKPLVFCGTGGIMPREINGEGTWIKHINPGDLAVMAGGRIGKDGIHGATFSSKALDDESPSSAVQIGDPITQKKMSDFLLEARDAGLYLGITDNGAGGLSSSLGEMAEYSNGVRIDLHKCLLKYKGLAPWEILVSESQERMSLAVKPEKIEAFTALAERRGVETSVVGEFTDSGFIDIRYGDKKAGLLSMDFLHRGLPEMKLKAVWSRPQAESLVIEEIDYTDMLKRLLNEPNIASKEPLVRQYDHEVGGISIVRPFTGRDSDAPSDGAVLKPVLDSNRGITVTHGICPRYGDRDSYNMALCAVDEAYRAHIASGGNPDHAAILDNFCWPDPVESEAVPDGPYKLAQLVRACKGLYKASMDYELPLISGKDSMKNDALIGGKKVSVRPTLLISLMGIIDNIEKAVTTDFRDEGDAIYIIGNTYGELGGTYFEKLYGENLGGAPFADTEKSYRLYKKLHQAISQGLVKSCHDISDGGLAVAIAESCLGGRLGADISLDTLPGSSGKMETARILFCETPSRFIAGIGRNESSEFESIMKDFPVQRIGTTTKTPSLRIKRDRSYVIDITICEISAAWKREDFE
jgi:phosphoribosylformylglycinamidine synthase